MPVPKVPAQLLVPIKTEAGDYDEKHVLTVSRLSGFCFGLLQPARHSRLAVIVVAAVKYRWTAQMAPHGIIASVARQLLPAWLTVPIILTPEPPLQWSRPPW
jgi:hypothetical protein